MIAMQLSPHFTLREFIASETAARRGIDNSLPAELLPAAGETAAMLERIRARLSQLAGRDIPMLLSSGYRSPALNRAIGGSRNSDHQLACAADWTAPAFGTPTEICRALADELRELGIGQLINEFPDRNGWVHTSTRAPARPINAVISITARGTFAGIQEA